MLNIYESQLIRGSKISTNQRMRLKHQFENKPKKTFLNCLEVVAKSFILICLSLNCFFQFACNQKLFFLPSYKMKLWNCDFEIQIVNHNLTIFDILNFFILKIHQIAISQNCNFIFNSVLM